MFNINLVMKLHILGNHLAQSSNDELYDIFLKCSLSKEFVFVSKIIWLSFREGIRRDRRENGSSLVLGRQ